MYNNKLFYIINYYHVFSGMKSNNMIKYKIDVILILKLA